MEDRRKPTWDCSDYPVGNFNPESFTPKLKWRITVNGYPNEFCKTRGLPRMIEIRATVFKGHELVLCSHPYGYGNFTADGYDFGFGGKYYWLNTTDPEDAVYRAERMLMKWAQSWMKHYEMIFSKLK